VHSRINFYVQKGIRKAYETSSVDSGQLVRSMGAAPPPPLPLESATDHDYKTKRYLFAFVKYKHVDLFSKFSHEDTILFTLY